MSNLQSFQQAFVVDFPPEIADQVLGRIQALYGTQFEKHYGNLNPHELQNLACTVLSGVSPKELKRGIDRMNSEKWCPTLPEFRSWCVSGGDWWTAEMAWVKALNFINDETKPMTALAKETLDEVQQVLSQEGQKAAHRAFVAIYDDYLQRAKNLGRRQEMYIPKIRIAHDADADNRQCVPCPTDLMARLKGAIKHEKVGRA